MLINIFIVASLICLINVYSYINPVQGSRDSPDPGAIYDGQFYYAATTGGWDGNWYPIWQSSNLFYWTQKGWGFPVNTKPAWATRDFWAP